MPTITITERLLTNLTTTTRERDDLGALVARLGAHLPWTRHLSPRERQQMARELADLLNPRKGQPRRDQARTALWGWHSTATAKADGLA